MTKYLGEVDVTHEHEADPVKDALRCIYQYGQIDGEHHKAWVLDQVVRILNGAPVTVKRASWDNGHSELRWSVGTCEQYEQWVKDYCYDEDEDEEYDYDQGIAP